MRLQFMTSCAFVRSVASLHLVAPLLAPSVDCIFGMLGETLPLFTWRQRLQSIAPGDFGRIAASLHSVALLLTPSGHDTLGPQSTCGLPSLSGAVFCSLTRWPLRSAFRIASTLHSAIPFLVPSVDGFMQIRSNRGLSSIDGAVSYTFSP